MPSSPDVFQQIYRVMSPMRLTPVSMGLKTPRWFGGSAVCASLRLIAVGGVSVAGPGEQTLVVSIADGPPFRSSAAISCSMRPKGARIQAGDFIETQPGNFIVADFAGGTVVAFGPLYRRLPAARRVDLHRIARLGQVGRAWTRRGDAFIGPSASQLGAAARQGVFVMHAARTPRRNIPRVRC